MQVVYKALIRAQNNHRVYGNIKERTKALMFFGVPHHGGNGVGVGKVLVQTFCHYLVASTDCE
jgi:hypothetical protein